MPELGTSGSAGGPGPVTAQVYPLSGSRSAGTGRGERVMSRRVALDRIDPVELSGLASCWATQRVDGGSAGVVAALRRARARAGIALRRDRSSLGPMQGSRRHVSSVWEPQSCGS
jgi:hypothetical protein